MRVVDYPVHFYQTGKSSVIKTKLRALIFCTIVSLVWHLTNHEVAANEEPDLFIQGIRGDNHAFPIGVQGVSYSLSPVNAPHLFLSLQETGYSLTSIIDKRSLFSFTKLTEDKNYYNCQPASHSFFGQEDKTWAFHSDDLPVKQFRIKINEGWQRRSSFLSDSNSNLVLKGFNQSEKDKIVVWQLQPVYEIDALHPTMVDQQSLLFKVTQKEPITSTVLSKKQIQALYLLHYQAKPEKQITAVYEDTVEADIYCRTPQLSYLKELYLTSADFPIRVYNVGRFFKGIGEYAADALNKKYFDPDEEILSIEKGQVLLLSPKYDSLDLPMLGNVEVTLGNKGYITTSYNGIKVKLRDIIQKRGQKGIEYSDFVVRYTEDTLSFIAINSWLKPATAGIIANEVTGNAAQDFERVTDAALQRLGIITKDLGDVGKEIGKSFERSSQNIAQAITNFSQAMVTSSENLSETGRICAKSFGDTVMFAARSFENAIQFLSITARATARETSESLTRNTNTIVQGLEHTMTCLDSTLMGVAASLENSSANVADSLKISSRYFKQALADVSNAVRDGTDDLSKAIEDASSNFVKGMKHVEKAAEQMKKTEHTVKHKVCILS
ncbi:MAG: hypothetical protein K0M45_08840 [Candidatus Paracaedibacteraceae bacterium]|nr:hypothetical protein [Candidatus Paracaedibacteraceae bacterium]